MAAKKKKGRILTGIRPTGPLHLGHYVGALQQWLKYQEGGEYEIFLLLADAQALTDHAGHPERIKQAVFDVTLDLLSIGLDPNICTFHIQTRVPEVFELTHYLGCVVPWAIVKRNPTIKEEIRQLKRVRKEPVTASFMVYPVSQAADILLPKGTLVPVGEDQLPHIELTRLIARRFNQTYGNVFPIPRAKVGSVGRLIGIDGSKKASKSLGNAIMLSDAPEVVDEKIRQMYTDPGHIRVSDPGKVEDNVPFIYLRVFDPDQAGLAQLEADYQKGGVGDMVIKKRLMRVLRELMEPIRERRAVLKKDPDQVYQILKEGTARHRQVAQATMAEVRQAMGLTYF